MWLCKECKVIWGFWSWVVIWLPFNGVFFEYEGSYWRALWEWLARDDGDEHDFR